MIDVERYIPFLEKHNMTQPQFLLLFCLYLKKYGLLKRYKTMFPTEDGSLVGSVQLNDLIKRGYLEKVNGEDTKVSGFKVTDKFTGIFVDKYQAALEFWELYPPFMTSNNVRYPLTAMSEDEFRELYYKKIDGNTDEHREVINDLKYAIDNNMVGMNISKFVSSRHWLAIRKERIKTNITSTNAATPKRL